VSALSGPETNAVIHNYELLISDCRLALGTLHLTHDQREAIKAKRLHYNHVLRCLNRHLAGLPF
jgi:hypothetical protein